MRICVPINTIYVWWIDVYQPLRIRSVLRHVCQLSGHLRTWLTTVDNDNLGKSTLNCSHSYKLIHLSYVIWYYVNVSEIAWLLIRFYSLSYLCKTLSVLVFSLSISSWIREKIPVKNLKLKSMFSGMQTENSNQTQTNPNPLIPIFLQRLPVSH